MRELDHWHPVLFTEELGPRPRGVQIGEQEIVVYRTESGRLGAYSDRCPHRGMRLSTGQVEGERLVCPYHGWRWGLDGTAEVPSTPRARPCARREDRFDVVDRYGAIWVKRHGSEAVFPNLDAGGYVAAGRFRHRANVPVELLLDNFIESEHTPFVHFMLGFSLEQMPQVKVETTTGDDWVRVVNRGPKRPLTRFLEKPFKIPSDAQMVVDWTTYFSPVYSLYHHYFLDPRTNEPVGYPLRSALFIVPKGTGASEVMSFFFGSLTLWSKWGLGAVLWPPLLASMNLELRLDCRILERLADKRPGAIGNVLGRFDKALIAARARIDRIYRGRTAAGPEAEPIAPEGHLPVAVS